MDPILDSPCSPGDTHCQEVTENIPLNPSCCNFTDNNIVACVVITSHCTGMFEREIGIEVICQGANSSEVRAGTIIVYQCMHV